MAYFLSPVANDQQCNANGVPLSGGKVYTYIAGTTTPAPTYTDAVSGTQQANPIVLNSLGLTSSPIWMQGGTSLKFVIQDSSGVTIRTVDSVAGINDTTNAASEWVETGFVPTYLSGTTFSVVGDQTPTMQVNRRVRTKNTAGYIYGRISAAVYSAGITTVTVVNDSGSLDSGLSLVATGFLSFSPTSLPYGIYAGSGANSDITSLTALTTVPTVVAQYTQQLQPISASVAANALTISASALSLDFRSSTLGSGAVTRVTGTPANLVVPASATLGTVSGVQSDVYVLALNNAGSIELAVVATNGGVDLSETGLISTTAISAVSSTVNVVYSASARTNVAYRVIGVVRSTQATAGTWATAPSLVQGVGGQALAAMSSFGYGQTWQIVTGSRAAGTNYYNTTGKPIFVQAWVNAGAASVSAAFNVNGSTNSYFAINTSIGAQITISTIVPPGSYYTLVLGSMTLTQWYELR